MEPHFMLHCSLNFCTMGSIFSVFLNVSRKFFFLILRVVSLLYQIPETSRLLHLWSTSSIIWAKDIIMLGLMHIKTPLIMLMMHQWISTLRFSQLKHCLQSTRFNVLLIIWLMTIDFSLLDFCHSFRKKKVYFFNGANVLFIIIFFYRCNFLRKDREGK